MSGWIGCDLDGTLADQRTGQPIARMVERVKSWLAAGLEVRIITARAALVQDGKPVEPGVLATRIRAVQAWCKQHIGEVLPVTANKDYAMLAQWDDRGVGVEPDTGLLSVDVAFACGVEKLAEQLLESEGILHGDEEHRALLRGKLAEIKARVQAEGYNASVD